MHFGNEPSQDNSPSQYWTKKLQEDTRVGCTSCTTIHNIELLPITFFSPCFAQRSSSQEHSKSPRPAWSSRSRCPQKPHSLRTLWNWRSPQCSPHCNYTVAETLPTILNSRVIPWKCQKFDHKKPQSNCDWPQQRCVEAHTFRSWPWRRRPLLLCGRESAAE